MVDTVDIFNGGKLLQDLFLLAFVQVVKHYPDRIGYFCFRKFLRHDVHADFHVGIVRQIFGHVFVDLDKTRSNQTGNCQPQHDHQNDDPFIHDKT